MIQMFIAGTGTVKFLWIESHMTGLTLQSDWDTQIPPQVVNWTKLFAHAKLPDPFPSLRLGVWGRDYRE